MTSTSIVSWLAPFTQMGQPLVHWLGRPDPTAQRHSLRYWSQHPDALPAFVRASPVAMRYVHFLAPLAWDDFPERDLQRHWDQPPVPFAPFAAACLVKLDQQLPHMSNLRQFLVDNPALVWVLGFPVTPSRQQPWGFEVEQSLPTQRHLTRMLRQMPNAALQFLLDSTVDLLRAELQDDTLPLGTCISLDTKHILAWVKENNPKAYIKSDRFNKDKQPSGDPDCRLGCKRRHNQRAASHEPPPTPSTQAVPANTLSVGEFYWGYASGIVATKVPEWGEVVLAELTQPFDQAEVSYFHPLMSATEKRLGFRPPFGALDAAFDAFYVYEYFHNAGGFAAVPFSERGGHSAHRSFSPEGAPLCQAGLPMALRYTFTSRSGLFEHECGRYICPLRFPLLTASTCPVDHARWASGGCVTTMATSIGARLRYQLDREAQAYKDVYKQRTATERINSQAVELGIERPKIRNGVAIANSNTLIYILINLRALQRIRQRKAEMRLTAQHPALTA
jgi:hypothetical protein